MLTRERMHELLEMYGLTDRADEIIADARPSIHLKLRYDVDEADIPIGASKMGGSPDVPADFEWPMWNGRYLSFIGQIRLSDMQPYDLEGLLPPSGMLYFFFEFSLYCENITPIYYTPAGPYCVIYLENENVPLMRMPHCVSEYPLTRYAKEPLFVQTEIYKACPIELEQEWTPRSIYQQNSQQYRSLRDSDPVWDWFKTAEDELEAPMHRLLGVETDIQGNFTTMEYASKAWKFGTGNDWMLLLQVDSDAVESKPGFMWVDGGLLYFCIHKDDLRERRFDRVWLDLIDP